jgi:hypothetical protein
LAVLERNLASVSVDRLPQGPSEPRRGRSHGPNAMKRIVKPCGRKSVSCTAGFGALTRRADYS